MVMAWPFFASGLYKIWPDILAAIVQRSKPLIQDYRSHYCVNRVTSGLILTMGSPLEAENHLNPDWLYFISHFSVISAKCGQRSALACTAQLWRDPFFFHGHQLFGHSRVDRAGGIKLGLGQPRFDGNPDGLDDFGGIIAHQMHPQNHII